MARLPKKVRKRGNVYEFRAQVNGQKIVWCLGGSCRGEMANEAAPAPVQKRAGYAIYMPADGSEMGELEALPRLLGHTNVLTTQR